MGVIGQLGDPGYLRKIPALFYEFQEIGLNETIGYKSPGNMRRTFTLFYWNSVVPYIGEAMRYGVRENPGRDDKLDYDNDNERGALSQMKQ